MSQSIRELRQENKELSRALEIERKRRVKAEEFIGKFRYLFSDLLEDVFEFSYDD